MHLTAHRHHVTDAAGASRSREVLSPVDRLSEVIFGLIMALSFTGSLSVATAGREDVRTMLIGALGCNTAWGIVDAVMYVFTGLLERNKELAQFRALRAAPDAAAGVRALAAALPSRIVEAMGPEDLERVRAVMSRAPEAPRRASLTWADLRGALACFLLVFLSTLPVALPFALVTDLHRALRISNGIAIALLFVAGYSLGQWAGFRPWVTGLVLVLLGVMLSAATIALGG